MMVNNRVWGIANAPAAFPRAVRKFDVFVVHRPKERINGADLPNHVPSKKALPAHREEAIGRVRAMWEDSVEKDPLVPRRGCATSLIYPRTLQNAWADGE